MELTEHYRNKLQHVARYSLYIILHLVNLVILLGSHFLFFIGLITSGYGTTTTSMFYLGLSLLVLALLCLIVSAVIFPIFFSLYKFNRINYKYVALSSLSYILIFVAILWFILKL